MKVLKDIGLSHLAKKYIVEKHAGITFKTFYRISGHDASMDKERRKQEVRLVKSKFKCISYDRPDQH